jgi:hypothetical protein
MPKYKPVIEVDKKDDARYRILNGLSKNREFIINNVDDEKYELLKKIGKSTSAFNLEYPIVWHTANRGNREKRLLKLPPELDLDEIPGDNKFFFRFRRRSII